MTALALALAMWGAPLQPPPQPSPIPWAGGRVLTTDTLHVGVRPAVDIDNSAGIEWGVGLTVQVTCDCL